LELKRAHPEADQVGRAGACLLRASAVRALLNRPDGARAARGARRLIALRLRQGARSRVAFSLR
jgi:hypothetical protein